MVVAADGGLHDVDDGGAAIHNDPLTVVFTLNAGFAEASFVNSIPHAHGQSAGLAVGCAGGDHHALEQSGLLLSVKHHDFLGFDVFKRIDDNALEFLDIFFSGAVRSSCGHASVLNVINDKGHVPQYRQRQQEVTND